MLRELRRPEHALPLRKGRERRRERHEVADAVGALREEEEQVLRLPRVNPPRREQPLQAREGKGLVGREGLSLAQHDAAEPVDVDAGG